MVEISTSDRDERKMSDYAPPDGGGKKVLEIPTIFEKVHPCFKHGVRFGYLPTGRQMEDFRTRLSEEPPQFVELTKRNLTFLWNPVNDKPGIAEGYISLMFNGKMVEFVSISEPGIHHAFWTQVMNFEDSDHATSFLTWISKKKKSYYNILTGNGFEPAEPPTDIDLIFDKDKDRTEQVIGYINRFIRSKHIYTKLTIPWRKGILLLGPPGNGKTSVIRKVIRHFKLPTYVITNYNNRDFTSSFKQAIENIAETNGPGIITLEDIDVVSKSEGTRQTFLNMVDGLDALEGIIVIATTNHPESLDPAIGKRPGRFDQRLTFGNPSKSEILKYLEMQLGKIGDEITLTARAIDRFAEDANENKLSFAYMKEVLASFLTQLAQDTERETEEAKTNSNITLPISADRQEALLKKTLKELKDLEKEFLGFMQRPKSDDDDNDY